MNLNATGVDVTFEQGGEFTTNETMLTVAASFNFDGSKGRLTLDSVALKTPGVTVGTQSEVILTNAMKAGFPKPSDKPDVYEVTFDNQAQIDKYELNQRDVMAFLRNELKNDAVMVTAKVRAKDANEKIWTQK